MALDGSRTDFLATPFDPKEDDDDMKNIMASDGSRYDLLAKSFDDLQDDDDDESEDKPDL